MKNRCLAVVLIIAGLFLAGCKFQAETQVAADGSGSLRTEVGFTSEERQSLEQQSGNNNSKDFCNSSASSQNMQVTEEQRGDETWCVTTTSFRDLDELRRLYEQKKGIRINRLEMVDGKFYYDLDIDTLSKSSDFSAFSSATWIVTMPGAPTYHNAAKADGDTLTWEIPPHQDSVDIRAESPVPAAGLTFPCGPAVAAPGLLLVWGRLSKRRNRFN